MWPTQQRLALCNILEDTPNQHWPNISRIMRQFALNSNMLEEPSVHAVAKVRFAVDSFVVPFVLLFESTLTLTYLNDALCM